MIWDHEKYLGFDFETSGEKPEYALQPWRIKQRKAWATSLVWATRAPGGVFDRIGGGLNPTRAQMVLMLETAIKENRRIVGWNVVYDIAILLGYGLHDLVFKCRWLDGMLLWRHVEVEPEYGIKGPSKKSFALKGKYADVEDEEADGTVTTTSQLASKGCVEVLWPDEAGYQEDIDFHDPDPLKRQRLHEYNIGDVKFTLRGAQHWWEALTPKQQGAALIEAESLPWIAAANLEGLPLDRIECSNLQANLALRAIDRMDRLGTFGFTKEIGASPAKLANLLFDVWRLPIYKRNKLTAKQQADGIKEGSRSTDKEVLHELGLTDKRVGIFQEYRSCVNNGKKFATAPLISADYNAEGNVTHPQGRAFSTYTGRMTYSSKQGRGVKAVQTGFALHQMNKKPEFRRIIIAPPGYDMIEFDAAGQEFRWMAVASRDQTMLHLCGPGQDPHSFLGSAIYKLDYMDLIARYKAAEEEAERQRKMGKVGNLSLQYRTSPPRLRITARVDYDIPMELPEAEHIHQTYQLTYPEVPRYWGRQISIVKACGYVETFAGRRVQIKGDWNGPNKWAMGSTAINYRIQGTGGDQKYLAIAVIQPILKKYEARFAFDLHDGLYFYVKSELLRAFAEEMKHTLDNLPYQRAWGMTPPIPMTWDAKAGPSWGNLKGVKF